MKKKIRHLVVIAGLGAVAFKLYKKRIAGSKNIDLEKESSSTADLTQVPAPVQA